MEGQLFELEQLQHELPLWEQATTKLEGLVDSASLLDFPQASSAESRQPGSELANPESLTARLEAAVESASLVAAELQSIHRQHVTTGLLLQQEEVRAKQLEGDLAETKVSRIENLFVMLLQLSLSLSPPVTFAVQVCTLILYPEPDTNSLALSWRSGS